MERLLEIENVWGVNPANPHQVSSQKDLIELATTALGIQESNSTEYINELFDDHINELIDIHNEIKKSSNDFESIVRINRVLEMSYYSQNLCTSLKRIQELLDHSKDFRDNTDASLFRFKAIDPNDNTKYQNFLLYILGFFYQRKYARYNGDVYKLINTTDGYNTFAWYRVGTITEIIYKSVCKETNYDQFINMTSFGGSVKAASEFLSNCSDNQFPNLEKDRSVFSFTNGIYKARENKFIAYDSDDYRSLSTNIVSAKYFNHEFTYIEDDIDWKTIETPYFDQIFEHQGIEEDVMRWVYAFTGRLLYEIDEMDGWQVIFFLQGQAGTGKSTYCNDVCKQFYDNEDVGVMSNNIQRTFGLADLVDKLLYVAPEIKKDFNMEQGEFQSIVSGDKVTINIKFKESRFETWKIPGCMAGNDCPDFIDNAGSIQRRMVTIRFVKKVTNADASLKKKLEKELHALIRKCNMAYREAAIEYGRKNIWSVLPKYFIGTQQELAKVTNPLMSFILSDVCVLGEGKYMPAKYFKNAFKSYCIENNFKAPPFNSNFTMGPFAQHSITIVNNEARIYNGRVEKGTYYEGIDLMLEECDIDENADL